MSCRLPRRHCQIVDAIFVLFAFACTFVLVSPFGAFAQDKDSQEAKDRKALQGGWLMERFEYNGREVFPGRKQPPPKESTALLEFDGDNVTVADRPAGVFKLDVSKSPKHITFVQGAYTLPAIYEIQGDTLYICWNDSRDPKRPTGFSTRDQKTKSFRLKRIKASGQK